MTFFSNYFSRAKNLYGPFMALGQEHHVPCCPRPSLISLCLDSSLASVSVPKGIKTTCES